jgi:hypothetical protein
MENGLKKFIDDTKGDPPRRVSASKLDENFKRCLPADRGIFGGLKWNFTQDGWYIDLTPPAAGTFVLGAVNGQIQWVATEDCD